MMRKLSLAEIDLEKAKHRIRQRALPWYMRERALYVRRFAVWAVIFFAATIALWSAGGWIVQGVRHYMAPAPVAELPWKRYGPLFRADSCERVGHVDMWVCVNLRTVDQEPITQITESCENIGDGRFCTKTFRYGHTKGLEQEFVNPPAELR